MTPKVQAKKEKIDKLDFIRIFLICASKDTVGGFPGGAVVKNPPANARDTGLSPGPGRSHMPRSN